MKKVLLFVSLLLTISITASAVNRESRSSSKKEKEPEAGLSGLKKVVAVGDFEMEDVSWGTDVAMNLGDMLVDKLVNTGKFIVVERDRKRDDMTLSHLAEREQAAKQSGMSRGKGADAGKAAAAQALFVGMISGAGKGSSFGGAGGGWGSGGYGLGGLGIATNKVSVIVRWYDTTSLEIKGSQECTQTQASLTLLGGGVGADSGGGGAGAGGGNFRSTLAKTFSKALDKCVNWIVAKMEKLPWEGKVISVKNGQVFLNAGTDAGVKVGDTFNVYNAGEELVDPDSGMSLGVEETVAGQIQVARSQPKFSIATILSGGRFKQGDVVRQQ